MKKLFTIFLLWITVFTSFGASFTRIEGVPSLRSEPGSLFLRAGASQTLSVFGSDLEGDITYVLGGADSAAFIVGKIMWDPRGGGSLSVTLLPSRSDRHSAIITFSSPGAASIVVPLGGGTPSVSSSDVLFADTEIDSISIIQKINVFEIDVRDGSKYTIINSSTGDRDASAFNVSGAEYNPETGRGSLTLTFTPTEPKEYKAQIEINGGISTINNVTLKGKGINVAKKPILTANLTEILFADQEVRVTGGSTFLEITGNGLIDDITYEVSGADASAFAVEENLWSSQTGGFLSLSFTPTDRRIHNAILTIRSQGAVSKVIPLSGKGISGLIVDLERISFGESEINVVSVAQVITVAGVELVGEINYSIGETSMHGSDASYFAVSEASWSPAVGGTLRVTFTPPSLGYYEANLVIRSSGVFKEIRLSGTGVEKAGAPILSVSKSSINFNQIETDTVAISGSDLTGDISYKLVEVDAAGNLIFSVNEVSWSSVTGGTLSVTVDYTKMTKASGASLIISSPGAVEKIITLTALPISVSSNRISFGDTKINTTSPVKTITVVGGGEYEFFGQDASAFEVIGDRVDLVTGVRILSLTFTPTGEAREYSASIEFPHPSISQWVYLDGTGVDDVIYTPILVVDSENLTFSDVDEIHYLSAIISGNDLKGDISYELSGDGASAFSIDETSWSSTTGGSLGITFNPIEGSLHVATLTISSLDAESKVLTLIGRSSYVATGLNNIVHTKVKVYPNPVVDKITVETDEQNIGKSIEIYSVYGTLVDLHKIIDTRTTIDVSSFAKGTYIIKINEVSIKVIKI